MHRFEASKNTTASPQEVFDYLIDPDNGPKWSSNAKEVRAEGDPGVGRTIISKAGMMGLTFEVENTVTEWDEPNRYAFGGDSPFHLAFEFTIEEDGDGSIVHGAVEVDPGKFFPVGGKLVARQFKKIFEKDVSALQKQLNEL